MHRVRQRSAFSFWWGAAEVHSQSIWCGLDRARALHTARRMLSVLLWLAFAQTIVAASPPWWRRDAFQVGTGLDSLDRQGEVRALFGACVALD